MQGEESEGTDSFIDEAGTEAGEEIGGQRRKRLSNSNAVFVTTERGCSRCLRPSTGMTKGNSMEWRGVLRFLPNAAGSNDDEMVD